MSREEVKDILAKLLSGEPCPLPGSKVEWVHLKPEMWALAVSVARDAGWDLRESYAMSCFVIASVAASRDRFGGTGNAGDLIVQPEFGYGPYLKELDDDAL
jgi:hypothetical protein